MAQDITPSLAFTALLEMVPNFGQMEASAGDVLVTRLVQAWRARTDQAITFWAFARKWIGEQP